VEIESSQEGKAKIKRSQAWWLMPIIQLLLVVGKQEDLKFEACPSKVSKTLSQKQNTNKRSGAWLKKC
jgi:hypothetical protein